MKNLFYFIFILFGHFSFAQQNAVDVDHNVLEAQKTLAPLKQQLLQALQGALSEGPAQNAVSVCQIKAPEIAKNLSQSGMALGRTSHKIRNPNNHPTDWAKKALKIYQKTNEKAWTDGQVQKFFFEKTANGYRYAEPIYVKAMCLTCHGEKLDPKLNVHIRSLYPQDKATGFKLGDFRGLFWLEKAQTP